MKFVTQTVFFLLVVLSSNAYSIDGEIQKSVEDAVSEAVDNAVSETVEEIEESVDDIGLRVGQLEANKKPKMIRPNLDVDFLFKAVLGGSYSASTDHNLKYNGKRVLGMEQNILTKDVIKLEAGSECSLARDAYKDALVDKITAEKDATKKSVIEDNASKDQETAKKIAEELTKEIPVAQKLADNEKDQNKRQAFEKVVAEKTVAKKMAVTKHAASSVTLTNAKNANTAAKQIASQKAIAEQNAAEKVASTCVESDYIEISSLPLQLKLMAVESELNIQSTKNRTLKSRITKAATEINNSDWQSDNLRFGVLTTRLPSSGVVTSSIALHSYFGYHRFLPGEWGGADLFRRFSVFFSAGTAVQAGDNDEIKGPVLGVGFGLDIVKGVVITAGYSVFELKDTTDDANKFENEEDISIGVSLNSDLWKGLFGSGS